MLVAVGKEKAPSNRGLFAVVSTFEISNLRSEISNYHVHVVQLVSFCVVALTIKQLRFVLPQCRVDDFYPRAAVGAVTVLVSR